MQDLLDRRLDWLSRGTQETLIRHGLRGIEKESLRVASNGSLSHRPHPPELGAALTHPYLTTDYSEALLEFVTPPLATNAATLQFLSDLHTFVHHALGEELLWPASMPCVLGANEEIPIAYYGRSNAGMMRTVYRRGLGHRYGRAMQAIAGTHFNFSPPESLWPAYREAERRGDHLRDFKSEQLMCLVRNYRRYGWLVIYLFGASPALCKSFKPEGHASLSDFDANTWYAPFATSLRMSDMGYHNKTQARFNISVNSLEEYIDGLNEATRTLDPQYAAIGVKNGGEYRQLNANILQIENEYYSGIRPKAKGKKTRLTAQLREEGVEYVEVRTLDLNAVEPIGLNERQARFLEVFLLYCLFNASPPIDVSEQREIDARDLLVAREGRRPDLRLVRNGGTVALREWGLEILSRIEPVAALLDGGGSDYAAAVAGAREAVADADVTPSGRFLAELEESSASFFEYALELARRHHRYFLALSLDAGRQAELSAAAAESSRRAEALEHSPDVPFEEYLRRYFGGA